MLGGAGLDMEQLGLELVGCCTIDKGLSCYATTPAPLMYVQYQKVVEISIWDISFFLHGWWSLFTAISIW